MAYTYRTCDHCSSNTTRPVLVDGEYETYLCRKHITVLRTETAVTVLKDHG